MIYMSIPILFENDQVLVINKPAGLVVHSDGKTNEPTLVDWILKNYPQIEGVGEDMLIEYKGQKIRIKRPGIVHRIDRDTSGCLVIAKTQDSFNHLKQQFKDRKVKKTYLAIVYGNIKEEKGTIDQPIARHPKDFRQWVAGNRGRGTAREAVTDYRVLGRYTHPTNRDKQGQPEYFTLVECSPQTGRTHQIRVHLKYLNHPIVADPIYRGKRKETLDLDRTALHAAAITFIDLAGNQISVQAEIPEDLNRAIGSLSALESDL